MFLGRDRRGWKIFLTYALVMSVVITMATRFLIPHDWTARVVGWCLCGFGGVAYQMFGIEGEIARRMGWKASTTCRS